MKNERWPSKIALGMVADAIGFSIAIMELYHALSERGKRRLRGSIIDALKRDFGFGPLRAENTVVYAMNLARCRISAEDLEGRSNFDYLCELKGLEFEVECKFITNDLGSWPKPREVDKFLIQLDPEPILKAIGPKRSLIITLTCENHLPVKERQLALLADWIACVAGTGATCAQREGFGLAVEEWGPGVEDPGSLYEKARDLAKWSITYTMAYARADRGFILGIMSSRETLERQLRAARRPLRDAISQFTGTRPAVLWIELDNIGPDREQQIGLGALFGAIMTELGETRPFLDRMILGFSGFPFSGGFSITLKNYHRSLGKHSEILDSLDFLSKPRPIGRSLQRWRNAWRSQWS